MIRSKRVVRVFSMAVIRDSMPDIRESSAAMREVVMTANTVNIRLLKTIGSPIANYSWTLSIRDISIRCPAHRQRTQRLRGGVIGP